MLKCTEVEAEQFTATLFAKFEKLKAFIARVQENARIQAEVRTLSGRRRKLPGFTSPHLSEQARATRQCVNSVIQGSAADIVKTAMVEICRVLLQRPELGARLVLQIHDELVFEVHKECAEELRGLVKAAMEGAASLAVRLEVTLSQGERWGHLSHNESGKEEFELLVDPALAKA